MTTLIDTTALYAILDRDDENHLAAAAAWKRVLGDETQLVATNYVLVESVALVRHRLGTAAVRVLMNDMLPLIRTEWITAEDHRAGAAAFLIAGRRGPSFVDCTSFEVMRRLGIRSAFTFDRHFAREGFDLLR